MPTHVGPNVLGDENIVFGYDLSDVVNSYRGEPTVNFVPGTYGYSTYAYVSNPVDTTVLNEKNQLITAKRYTITQSINVARAAIFPVGLTTGVSFTFSFKWKYNGSTTASPSVSISAQKGNPEGGSNNNSFTSESTNTVNIGSGWYLSTHIFIFSSVPTGKCMLTFGIVTGSNSGYIGETFDIYEAQFEIKNHRTQFSNGVRSATQGLIDLKGTSTINLANVSFDSNAQIEFDGTDDFITPLSPSDFRMGTNSFTLETVVKQDITTAHVILEARGNNLIGYLWTVNYGGAGRMSLFYNDGISSQKVHYQTGDFNITLTQKYYHLVVKVDKGDNKIYFYIDGEQAGNGVVLQHTNSISPTSEDFYRIGFDRGGTPWNGQIAVFKHYNRSLSSSEVLNNYNNIKRKYGI